MATSKKKYMETYDPLASRYYNIILEKIKEEQNNKKRKDGKSKK